MQNDGSKDRLLRATGTGEGGVTFTRCEGGDRGQRARAALYVTNPHDIPERFNLVFKADGTHIPCHVIWRQEEQIGVAFD